MFASDAHTGNGIMWRSPRLLLPVIIVFSLLSLWYTRSHTQFSVGRLGFHKASAVAASVPASDHFPEIRNATLGFQQVYILNLPERTDKLDTFSLTSSISNFTFAVIPGVDGATVPDKSLPSTKGLDPMESKRNKSVGSWRAHLNFALAVVRNRLSSAIVFEDDADWDIEFKSQLEYLAAGSRYLSTTPSSSKLHSPYGDDWDLLWPGHCGIGYHEQDRRRFVIDNDPAVPPPNHRVTFGNNPNMSAYDNSTRVVFRANGGVCVYSYALSYRGAQKLLYHENSKSEYIPFDLSLDGLCRHDPDFKCIGIFPQIIDSHKAAGAVNRDSDIGEIKGSEQRKNGYTFNIVRSVRVNLSRLISGKGEELKLQWNDQPKLEGDITTRVE